jgi:hypothetical protein
MTACHCSASDAAGASTLHYCTDAEGRILRPFQVVPSHTCRGFKPSSA